MSTPTYPGTISTSRSIPTARLIGNGSPNRQGSGSRSTPCSARSPSGAALVLNIGCGTSSRDQIDRLTNEDWEVRRQAAVSLGEAKVAAALDTLIEVLKTDENSKVRDAAARALGYLGDARATPALLSLVENSNEVLQLRVGAVDALRDLRDPTSIPELIAVWRIDGDRNGTGVVHAAIAFALVKMAPLSYEPLIAALGDAHRKVRGYAAHTLGLIGDKRASEAIKSLLEDPDGLVRHEAKYALERLTEP